MRLRLTCRWVVLSVIISIVCSGALGLSGCDRPGASIDQSMLIAVIPKGTSHDFWKSVHAGAIQASRELDVRIIWQGPEKEDDRQQQQTVVENMVIRKVSGIVLAPLDAQALVRSVDQASARAIPVVIIDSDLASDRYVSFVATDNRQGGELAGEHLAQLLGGKGRVILLRYLEGSASTANREQGFLDAMAMHPDIQVVSSNQYAGATKEQAQAMAENLLLRFTEEGRLTVDGIFCPNESSAHGMLRALQQAGHAGKVRFVGFDASVPLVEALRHGQIDALTVQNPMRMGYLGVKTMVEHLRGQPVAKRVDTGVALVTAANMTQPEMEQLLNPDLERWLGGQ